MSEKKFKILVVDDDEDLREAIEIDLSRKGYDVVTAENGRQAYEIITKEPPDLVISDIRMPDWDGVRLLNELKQTEMAIPLIIFITAHSDLAVEDAYAMGAHAVFSKPYDRKELFGRITEILSPPERRWVRKHGRFNSDFSIDLENNEESHGRALNIGRGGCFVAMTSNFPQAGDEVPFKLEVEGQTISGVGKIRWVRKKVSGGLPAGYGLEFIQVDESSMEHLVKVMKKLTPNDYIPKK